MLYVLPYGQMSLWGELFLSCPKCIAIIIQKYWFFIINFSATSFFLISIYIINNTVAKRIKSDTRIGPHNKDIISIFYGSLLGDSHAEKRNAGIGTRLSFSQESNRKQYLLWLHNLISELGYCSPSIPIIQSRIGFKGIIRYIIRFHTYTYSSLNWLHEVWYPNGKKVIPRNIEEYLTPLAIAI